MWVVEKESVVVWRKVGRWVFVKMDVESAVSVGRKGKEAERMYGVGGECGEMCMWLCHLCLFMRNV